MSIILARHLVPLSVVSDRPTIYNDTLLNNIDNIIRYTPKITFPNPKMFASSGRREGGEAACPHAHAHNHIHIKRKIEQPLGGLQHKTHAHKNSSQGKDTHITDAAGRREAGSQQHSRNAAALLSSLRSTLHPPLLWSTTILLLFCLVLQIKNRALGYSSSRVCPAVRYFLK